MIKEIDDKEYEIVSGWWKAHKADVPNIPKEICPDGFICYIEDKPVVATWVYNAPGYFIGYQAWTTINPEADRQLRNKGFDELMAHVEGHLKEKGVLCMLAGINNASLMKRFVELDYKVTDTDIVFMTKAL